MSKRKNSAEQVTSAYLTELASMFPGIESTIESVNGLDVYVRVEVPPELIGSYDDIADTTPKLNYRYWDETDVFIVAVVVPKEAVPHV
jgi:hypothetical protein